MKRRECRAGPLSDPRAVMSREAPLPLDKGLNIVSGRARGVRGGERMDERWPAIREVDLERFARDASETTGSSL